MFSFIYTFFSNEGMIIQAKSFRAFFYVHIQSKSLSAPIFLYLTFPQPYLFIMDDTCSMLEPIAHSLYLRIDVCLHTHAHVKKNYSHFLWLMGT